MQKTESGSLRVAIIGKEHLRQKATSESQQTANNWSYRVELGQGDEGIHPQAAGVEIAP